MKRCIALYTLYMIVGINLTVQAQDLEGSLQRLTNTFKQLENSLTGKKTTASTTSDNTPPTKKPPVNPEAAIRENMTVKNAQSLFNADFNTDKPDLSSTRDRLLSSTTKKADTWRINAAYELLTALFMTEDGALEELDLSKGTHLKETINKARDQKLKTVTDEQSKTLIRKAALRLIHDEEAKERYEAVARKKPLPKKPIKKPEKITQTAENITIEDAVSYEDGNELYEEAQLLLDAFDMEIERAIKILGLDPNKDHDNEAITRAQKNNKVEEAHKKSTDGPEMIRKAAIRLLRGDEFMDYALNNFEFVKNKEDLKEEGFEDYLVWENVTENDINEQLTSLIKEADTKNEKELYTKQADFLKQLKLVKIEAFTKPVKSLNTNIANLVAELEKKPDQRNKKDAEQYWNAIKTSTEEINKNQEEINKNEKEKNKNEEEKNKNEEKKALKEELIKDVDIKTFKTTTFGSMERLKEPKLENIFLELLLPGGQMAQQGLDEDVQKVYNQLDKFMDFIRTDEELEQKKKQQEELKRKEEEVKNKQLKLKTKIDNFNQQFSELIDHIDSAYINIKKYAKKQGGYFTGYYDPTGKMKKDLEEKMPKIKKSATDIENSLNEFTPEDIKDDEVKEIVKKIQEKIDTFKNTLNKEVSFVEKLLTPEDKTYLTVDIITKLQNIENKLTEEK